MTQSFDDIDVRQLEENQWELLKNLRIQALEDSPRAFSDSLKGTLEKDDEYWRDRALSNAKGEDRVCFVLYDNDLPRGLAVGLMDPDTPDCASLVSMWVHPDQRRGAPARALLDRVVHWAGVRGASTLYAGVTRDNTRALRFYQLQGFDTVDDNTGVIGTQGCQTILSRAVAL